MSKKKGGGKGFNSIIGGIVSLAMVGVVLATFQLLGVGSISNGIDLAKEKAKQYSECMPKNECGIISVLKGVNLDANGFDLAFDGQKIDRPADVIKLPEREGLKFDFKSLLIDRDSAGYRGPERGEAFVTTAGLVNVGDSQKMLKALKTVPDNEDDKKDVGYSRKEWKHWTSFKDRSCWNTREEVLKRDGVQGSVKLIDKEKKSTKDSKSACAIGEPLIKSGKTIIDTNNSGKWIDPYSDKMITNSDELDIDHIIPLSNAARNGGQKWSAKEKETFANDLDNLLATSAKENRSKGDKGPGKYMPPSKKYKCQYAKSYITVAYKYNLSITESDKKMLDKTLKSCEN